MKEMQHVLCRPLSRDNSDATKSNQNNRRAPLCPNDIETYEKLSSATLPVTDEGQEICLDSAPGGAGTFSDYKIIEKAVRKFLHMILVWMSGDGNQLYANYALSIIDHDRSCNWKYGTHSFI